MDVRRFRRCGLLVALALLLFGLEAQSASPFDEVGRFYMQNFRPPDVLSFASRYYVTHREPFRKPAEEAGERSQPCAISGS